MIFGKNKNDMWLIAGLGNPGLQYEKTRHNAGFMAADRLAEKHGAQFNKHKFDAVYADFKINDNRILLVKPQTYMNLSGDAVGEAARFYKIPAEKVIVVSDETALPIGRLRVRRSGSAGGHNGLKSIIAALGGENFPRIRLGVGGKPHEDYDMRDWVLSRVTGQDLEALTDAAQRAAKAAVCYIENGPDRAMNEFNQGK